jgi:hypothetical protein
LTASACCPVSLGDRSAKDIQGVEVILGSNRGALFVQIRRKPSYLFPVCVCFYSALWDFSLPILYQQLSIPLNDGLAGCSE